MTSDLQIKFADRKHDRKSHVHVHVKQSGYVESVFIGKLMFIHILKPVLVDIKHGERERGREREREGGRKRERETTVVNEIDSAV